MFERDAYSDEPIPLAQKSNGLELLEKTTEEQAAELIRILAEVGPSIDWNEETSDSLPESGERFFAIINGRRVAMTIVMVPCRGRGKTGIEICLYEHEEKSGGPVAGVTVYDDHALYEHVWNLLQGARSTCERKRAEKIGPVIQSLRTPSRVPASPAPTLPTPEKMQKFVSAISQALDQVLQKLNSTRMKKSAPKAEREAINEVIHEIKNDLYGMALEITLATKKRKAPLGFV